METSPGTRTAPPAAIGFDADDARIRRVYFVGLGLVCLIATISLWAQIHALVGVDGLLPAVRYFDRARTQLGPGAFWVLPSLGWFAAGDAALHVYCGAAALLSVGLAAGLAPRATLILLWLLLLSLIIAGQDFLSFQWDTLLLETLVCSILYAPRGWRPRWDTAAAPHQAARWLLWSVPCKLMLLSGLTKLLSGDSSWLDGTALNYHYFTQPLPNPLSWFAHHLPNSVHRLSLAVMFAVEVLLPLLVFAGRRGRTLFGLSTIVLMVLIELTGNYGFFNIQTVVLCLPLLDAGTLRRLGIRLRRSAAAPAARDDSRRRAWVVRVCCAGLLTFSGLVSVRELVRTARPAGFTGIPGGTIQLLDAAILSWSEPYILARLAPWRTINGYGLFRVMTTRRFEIVMEISSDGTRWEACPLRFQPGPVDRRPPLVAPDMPRLDWQMWFAGLNPRGAEHWLAALVAKVQQGNPGVCRLIGHPELVDAPPEWVRLIYYEYRFSDPLHRQASGAWWSRSQMAVLMPPRQVPLTGN